MKQLTHLLVTVVAAFLLAGCHARQGAQTSGSTSPAATELKRSLDMERESRLTAEKRLAEQEQAKSHWQTAALLALSGAVVLLVVGAALGSQTRAKYDSRKKT